jgi:hypothetical protein
MKSVKKEPVDKPGTGGRNLIGHFQKVAQTLEKSGLDPATVKKISGSISIIRSFLGCTADQAMLFSVIFILNFRQQAVTFSDMAEFLECSEFDIVRYLPDLEDLVRKRLLRTEGTGATGGPCSVRSVISLPGIFSMRFLSGGKPG